jgi:NhaP-type Na+/H+ or K+/H+ antiporter
MMPLAIIGVLIVALIVGYGVYMLTQNVTLKDNKNDKDEK